MDRTRIVPLGASTSATYNTKEAQVRSVQYVGMDVDKQKIVLARLGAGQDARAVEQVIANTPRAVKKYFSALVSAAEVHATYEAGCFGFGLYRQLSAMGVTVVLAAPGLIPRKPADRVKTDRRDAHSLALALRAGQLTGIYVPTQQDESVRDFLRMYEALRGDLRICKQRILQFLLRRELSYGGGGPWTVKHRHWLSTLEFEQPRDRQTLDMYLSQMQELEAKCAEAASELESIAAEDCYRQQTKKLTAFKGIKTLIALSFIVRKPYVDLGQVPILGHGVALWFCCDDSLALCRHLKENGVEVLDEPSPGPFGMTFHFRDPDGYAITVHDKA